MSEDEKINRQLRPILAMEAVSTVIMAAAALVCRHSGARMASVLMAAAAVCMAVSFTMTVSMRRRPL